MIKSTVDTKTRNLMLRLRHNKRNRQQSLLERGVERVVGQRSEAVR